MANETVNKPAYLVIDVDDGHHVCYVDDVLDSAVVHAEKALHVYVPMGQHADDLAAAKFFEAMKVKLGKARDKGYTGWDNPELCTTEFLCDQLIGHLGKGNDGNFEDIANFAMMLHQRGDQPYKLAEAKARQWPMTVFLPNGHEVMAPYDESVLSFSHEGTCIVNPFVSECGRGYTSPETYGFEVHDAGDGYKAYRKTLPHREYMQLATSEGKLPDKPEDAQDSILCLYTDAGDPIAAINISDIPMGG